MIVESFSLQTPRHVCVFRLAPFPVCILTLTGCHLIDSLVSCKAAMSMLSLCSSQLMMAGLFPYFHRGWSIFSRTRDNGHLTGWLVRWEFGISSIFKIFLSFYYKAYITYLALSKSKKLCPRDFAWISHEETSLLNCTIYMYMYITVHTVCSLNAWQLGAYSHVKVYCLWHTLYTM